MTDPLSISDLVMQLGFGGVAIYLLWLFRKDVTRELGEHRKESREDRQEASAQASTDRQLFAESARQTNHALAVLEERTRRDPRLEVVKDASAD